MDRVEQQIELTRGLSYGLLHAVVADILRLDLKNILTQYNGTQIPQTVVEEAIMFTDVAIESGVDPYDLAVKLKCEVISVGLGFGAMMFRQEPIYVLGWGRARTFVPAGQIVWQGVTQETGNAQKTWRTIPVDGVRVGASIKVLFEGHKNLTSRKVYGMLPLVQWESCVPELVIADAKRRGWPVKEKVPELLPGA